ncbi:MAG TPA: GDCCVxC domain-containing (seleno)protein [Steroidobacteraceae bacterium]|nr:GDCCVxC domain-containing (seleno)protein [Steroidobacteraceae bacterium]
MDEKPKTLDASGGGAAAPASVPLLSSELTCPSCGARYAETMPVDACIYFFECTACGATLKPKPGDCCVFCSYGSVPCPPVQLARAEPGAHRGCCS